jgi:hypothetical protein
MTKKEATDYLRWVKINFIQIGNNWTDRLPTEKIRLYTDEELFDYYMDYLNEK